MRTPFHPFGWPSVRGSHATCTTTKHTSCACAHDHFREFRTGSLPVTSSHVTDVTSGEEVPLRRILCNFRLRMRITLFRFRTGPLPVTQLPVISGHVTHVTSGHVSSGCSTSLHLHKCDLSCTHILLNVNSRWLRMRKLWMLNTTSTIFQLHCGSQRNPPIYFSY